MATDVEAIGDVAGDDEVVITVQNMPAHTHEISTRVGDNSDQGYAPNPHNDNPGNNWSWRGSQTSLTGKGEALKIVPRHVKVIFYIKVK